MADRKADLERAVGPVETGLDRERVYAGVQSRLRKDRMMRPVRRVLAVGAIVLVGAIALSRTAPPPTPHREPAVATRTPEDRAPTVTDWLAIAQAPGTRMTTRSTPRGVDIVLHEGGVAAEVRPDSGRTLHIETQTATIEVVGTTLAVLARAGATDVLVGIGRVVVSDEHGGTRPLRAGQSVSIATEIAPLEDPHAADALLSSLPGRWHPRHLAARPAAPVSQADPAPAVADVPDFETRGCEAAAEAAAVAAAPNASRASRRAALETLGGCGTPAERIPRLEALVALVPSHPVAWFDLGRQRERARDSAGAAAAYGRHLEVAGHGPLADDAALALCRVTWDRRACLERFLSERPDSDRRREAEADLQALQR